MMKFEKRVRALFLPAIAAVILIVPLASAAQPAAQGGDEEKYVVGDYGDVPTFGGPSSVGAQIKSDDESKETTYRFEGFSKSLQPYYDFKDSLEEDAGLAFGVDYSVLGQHASRSLGEYSAVGSVFRFFGTWTLLGRDTPDTGSLTYKLENRHRLASIAPQALASQIGYAGLTASTFSNAGWLLTNLFWRQSFDSNRWAMVAGIVDTTDYVNVYGLVSPWTDFSNQAFSNFSAIPAPDQGLGAALRVMITDNVYVLGGVADANGDPADPGDSFQSFFDEREYYKHIEVGWVSSFAERFTDNIHLTLWKMDARTAAGIPDGQGGAFSFSKRIGERWLPFLRIGYSDGGGGVTLERSVSAGVGYFRQSKSDVLGVGLNWGQPSEKTFGPGLRDQITAEIFYRIQLFPHMTITPDLQYLRDPALNPNVTDLWVVGLRARLSF
jgi:porin